MEDIGDDDHLFDDGFDDIPDNALYELEQNALLSTQHPAHAQQRLPSRSDTVANDGSTIQKSAKVSNRPGLLGQTIDLHLDRQAQRPRPFQPTDFSQQHSLSRDFIDEASLPTPTEEKVSFLPQFHQDEVTLREQFRLERFGPAASRPDGSSSAKYQKQPAIGGGSDYRYGEENDAMLLEDQQTFVAPNNEGDVAQALRAQIQELLKERDDLTKELHATNSNLQTQRGEIAIIRANQAKATKTYDRQIAVLKKTAEEEAARHRGEIEATRQESERITTENQFLKQDLTEEAKRVKGLRQNLRDKSKDDQGVAQTSTPKRTKILPHRDGFDDEDIRIISPSKSALKQKKTTPTAGNKRKRSNVNDLPIAPLVLDDTRENSQGVHQSLTASESQGGIPSRVIVEVKKEDGLRFLQKIHSYHPFGGKENTLECLARYAFPSNEKLTFFSIVIEDSSRLRGDNLPASYAKILASLWSKALKKKYYAPIALLMDILRFIIAMDSVQIAPILLPDLLPILQASGKINGIPRFEHSPVSRVSMGRFKFTPKSNLTPEVNATCCLEILLDIAYACSHTEDHINLFWQTMDIDFVLIMLNSAQPIADMTLNLNLLATSIRNDTFGNIVAVEEEQATVEKHIIERVTCLLWETPRVDEGEQQYTAEEVSALRVEVMSLLSLLAFSSPRSHESTSSHGSKLLAYHPAAIGRLVRSIYDEVAALYSTEPTRRLHATLVNEGTRLFHQLLEIHGDEIDLHQKLQAVNGGVQKHAVVLTRLAFRDGPLMEEGILDETCMMAHEMLEQVITPEEAEALLEVFPTQRSKR